MSILHLSIGELLGSHTVVSITLWIYKLSLAPTMALKSLAQIFRLRNGRSFLHGSHLVSTSLRLSISALCPPVAGAIRFDDNVETPRASIQIIEDPRNDVHTLQ